MGDLDRDGNEDAVIGAPGYRVGHSPQVGAVFILFGESNILHVRKSHNSRHFCLFYTQHRYGLFMLYDYEVLCLVFFL